MELNPFRPRIISQDDVSGFADRGEKFGNAVEAPGREWPGSLLCRDEIWRWAEHSTLLLSWDRTSAESYTVRSHAPPPELGAKKLI